MDNLDKYYLGGMGLHSIQLLKIIDIIKNNNCKTIVEFGSGGSTSFLCNLREEMNLEFNIYSFDHSYEYCSKLKKDYLNLKVLDLVACSDENFENIFLEKKYNKNFFSPIKPDINDFRSKNTFYDISINDLPKNIDFILLDGPNGNGRSISFLHLKNKISKNCHILIDDSDHYDFIDRCKQVFDIEILVHEQHHNIHPLFNYAILKLTEKK